MLTTENVVEKVMQFFLKHFSVYSDTNHFC